LVEVYQAKGNCDWHGDSGGLVYSTLTGDVWARGVISGSSKATQGQKDNCYAWFTNIAHARWFDGGNPLITK
jgi:hypothetical protein